MMNNALKRRLLLYVLCGLVVVGCYDTVYFDGEEAKVLVLNAVLVEGRDSVEVILTETKAAYDTSAWRTFPEAEVRLYEDGKEVGQGEWRPDGRFVVPVRVKEKCTYRVEAVVPDRGMVWGETTVPERVAIRRLEVEREEGIPGDYRVVCEWTDMPGKANRYWLGARQTTAFSDGRSMKGVRVLKTDSALPDPMNRIYEGLDSLIIAYDQYIRIEDAGRDGEGLCLVYRFTREGSRAVAYLLNMDVCGDAYLKSLFDNAINSKVWEGEIPWMFHPAVVCSNVEGGMGLVASWSVVQTM